MIYLVVREMDRRDGEYQRGVTVCTFRFDDRIRGDAFIRSIIDPRIQNLIASASMKGGEGWDELME